MKTKLGKNSLMAALLLGLAFTSWNCSKDSDDPAPDTRLVLPAVLENNTVFAIPDPTAGCGSASTAPGNIESTIEITADGIIADPTKLSVEVDLNHTWGGDIVLELITPSGESVGLIKRIGGATDTSCGNTGDFIAGNKLTFNSANVTTLTVAPYATGDYAPTSGTSTFPVAIPMTPLATFFTGKNIKGIWKLKAYDYGDGDFGNLNSWKLKFATGALQ